MYGKTLVALVCALLPFAATANSQNDERLIDRYTALGGSKQNAKALVTGLLEGKEVKLVRGGATQRFTAPTGKMEYSDVDITLALTEASLKERKIAQPSPAQLQTTVMEILKMRGDGKAWAEIAQTHGYKFAEAKRAPKPVVAKAAEKKAAPEVKKKPAPAVVPAADFGYRSPRMDSR